ncbi:MAG: hypothetical protein WCY11_19965 [Novosphingobium sp.]
MRKLTKIAIPALAAALAFGSAGTASAHSINHNDHRTPVRAEQVRLQIAKLEQRVNINERRDYISSRMKDNVKHDERNIDTTVEIRSRVHPSKRE